MMSFSWMHFTRLKRFTSPSLLSFLITKWCWIFSNTFLAFVEMVMWFCPFFLLIWCVILINWYLKVERSAISLDVFVGSELKIQFHVIFYLLVHPLVLIKIGWIMLLWSITIKYLCFNIYEFTSHCFKDCCGSDNSP